MFSHLPLYAGDPILSLQQAYASDPRPDKVNLGIGAYQDESGQIPTLAAVAQARELRCAQPAATPYQPIAGAANYRQAVQRLVFGDERLARIGDRTAAIQSLGGSGALKVGSDLLHHHFPESQVWVSNPSWPNHAAIFGGSGFAVNSYRYFDPATNGVDFEGMLEDLRALPARSIVVLHPACHNPTGADLTREQWDQVIPVLAERGVIPFVDMAYQGFGEGFEQDGYAVNAMVDAGLSLLLSVSFSKTFSLYGERVGALVVVSPDAEQSRHVFSQMELAIRSNYSSPPTWGGQLVATVLTDDAMRQGWMAEVDHMRTRMQAMRGLLHDRLVAVKPDADVGYLVTQRGMFSYTGLSPAQVERLRHEHAIFVVNSGRICVAGLRDDNVGRVADAFAQVMAGA